MQKEPSWLLHHKDFLLGDPIRCLWLISYCSETSSPLPILLRWLTCNIDSVSESSAPCDFLVCTFCSQGLRFYVNFGGVFFEVPNKSWASFWFPKPPTKGSPQRHTLIIWQVRKSTVLTNPLHVERGPWYCSRAGCVRLTLLGGFQPSPWLFSWFRWVFI